MIRILHCADLHLDSPLASLPLAKAEVRRRELRAAFTSLTFYAKLNRIDFILIAGDLFESDYVSRDTLALVVREFAALTKCRIIIQPGNHDPYTKKSCYKRTEFPENVYIFDSEELSCFDFPDKNVTIYGYAFTSSELDHCPFEGARPSDPNRINILMAHGELGDGFSKKGPIPVGAIRDSGFDYVALGHYHKRTEVDRLGSSYYAYCGCLEGRGFDELGEKGAIACALEKTDVLKFGSKFLRFSKCRYELRELDITGAATNSDVSDRLAALIAEEHFGEDVALRVILTGKTDSSLHVASDFLTSRFTGLFLLELIDRTSPTLDAQQLENDPTIRGSLYRALESELGEQDTDRRELACEALRLGLAAIAGDELD